MSARRFEVYAPVIIPTLCRYEHFKRCIDSLSRCTGAEFTDVYIGLDYPAKEEHWEGYKKICEYVKTVSGFNNFFVFSREYNFGISRNINDLKEQVKRESDRFIFSEDDNEFAPNFLEYMNECLTRFKDDPNVVRICGCLMPWNADYNKIMGRWKYNAFPAHDYNASGIGAWFDKSKLHPYTKDSVLNSWRLTFKSFRYGAWGAINRMLDQLKKESQLPDVCMKLYCTFDHKYSIFPSVSKVKNWGYDGTGLNSDNNLKLIDLQILDTSEEFYLDEFDIIDYPEVESYVNQMFVGNDVRKKIIILLSYLFYRITGMRVKDVRERMLKTNK